MSPFVVVTGVDGFSGSNLKKHLNKFKQKCIGISRSQSKPGTIKWDLTKNFRKKINFTADWIIHIASIHKTSDYKRNPIKSKNNNILMTKNLINFAKKNSIDNIIFFSTIDISYRNILGKKKFYNLSKICSEKLLLKAYKNKVLKKVIILRIPAILGKNANENFLITTLKKLQQNREIFIEDKAKFNNFIHIKDLCNLVMKILKFSRKKINAKKDFTDIIDCLSSGSIHISKKIHKIKRDIKSSSSIVVEKSKINNKIHILKKNKFNHKFMNCNKAIQLLLKSK